MKTLAALLLLPTVALSQNIGSATASTDPLVLKRPDGVVIHFDSLQKRREYEAEQKTNDTATQDHGSRTALAPTTSPASRSVIPFTTPDQATRIIAAGSVTEPPPLIALDVRLMQTGTSYEIHWLTDYGSIDYTGHANKALDLDARNLSAHSGRVSLEWIFTARFPRSSGRFIFDMGQRNWEMKPSEEIHFGVQSADLAHRAIIYAALGSSSYHGAEIDGWIVIARFNTKIIKAIGSTSTLEELARGNGLDAMISDYTKASSSKAHALK